MSTLEAAVAVDTPERARSRLLLALANAAMAGLIGALTLGPAAAAVGAVAMLLLPYLPVLLRTAAALVKTNMVASAGAAFILSVAAGTVVWGLIVAYAVALMLAPVMLLTVCVLAGANSLEE